MNQPPVFRIRLTYSKLQALRYTGSLDMQKIWERSFRRAGLPLAYSQGFHPQARINQALPLPLGLTSSNDMAEFWLDQVIELPSIIPTLNGAVPPGLEITGIEKIDLHAPSLPSLIKSAIYQVVLLQPVDIRELKVSVTQLISESHIWREKRGKTYDLRSLIEFVHLESLTNDGASLTMQLSAREGATGRPEEVFLALGLDPFEARIERKKLIIA